MQLWKTHAFKIVYFPFSYFNLALLIPITFYTRCFCLDNLTGCEGHIKNIHTKFDQYKISFLKDSYILCALSTTFGFLSFLLKEIHSNFALKQWTWIKLFRNF